MTDNNPKNVAQSETSNIPHQLVIFGPPGTGKSYKIHGRAENVYWKDSYAAKLGITSSEQIVNAVFHPEYTYGDFIGRLLPTSTLDGGKVKYGYRPGHFLIALSEAYNRLVKGENVLLVIDELNRGNAAAIFGSVFNLLDRNEDGWSSYPISLSNMEYESFLHRLLPEAVEFDIAGAQVKTKTNSRWTDIGGCLGNIKDRIVETKGGKDHLTFKVQLPPNLYILTTINTSDESIYYMDSAFKRRWDWEYMDEDGKIMEISIPDQLDWGNFRANLNKFLKSNGSSIRRLEDKLLGPRFIKGTGADANKEMNARDLAKVMFHLWDSVFARDKKPLKEKVGNTDLNTFGDFVTKANAFVTAVNAQA
jgi:5-methylcytosine-specific restriction enzyme B